MSINESEATLVVIVLRDHDIVGSTSKKVIGGLDSELDWKLNGGIKLKLPWCYHRLHLRAP